MGRKTHVYPIPYGGWRHLTSLTLSPRGCRFRPTPGNPRKSGFRPHVALYKLDLFKNSAHMHKIWQNSQKLSVISRFQNIVKLKILPNLESQKLS